MDTAGSILCPVVHPACAAVCLELQEAHGWLCLVHDSPRHTGNIVPLLHSVVSATLQYVAGGNTNTAAPAGLLAPHDLQCLLMVCCEALHDHGQHASGHAICHGSTAMTSLAMPSIAWHCHAKDTHTLHGFKGHVAAGQVGQEEPMEQRCLFITAGHLGFLRFWDIRSVPLLRLHVLYGSLLLVCHQQQHGACRRLVRLANNCVSSTLLRDPPVCAGLLHM